MRSVFMSHFFVRFAGGFAIGALALAVLQPTAVDPQLSAQQPSSVYSG